MSSKKERKRSREKGIKACRDHKECERKRKEEGGVKGARIKQLRKLIRSSLHDADEYEAARIVCLVDMIFRNHRTGSTLRTWTNMQVL